MGAGSPLLTLPFKPENPRRQKPVSDNDTAEWRLNKAKTPGGGHGIKGYDEGNGLNFTLLEMPQKLSYACWVTLNWT